MEVKMTPFDTLRKSATIARRAADGLPSDLAEKYWGGEISDAAHTEFLNRAERYEAVMRRLNGEK